MGRGVLHMRNFATLLIIAGLIFIGFGGYQLIQTEQAQSKSLEEAKTLLASKKNTHNQSNDDSTSPEEFVPEHGETVGLLQIPRLEAELPIVEGTNEDDLEKGVGHYAGTAYPFQNDQIVLSGHRDTVFRRMGELEIGDLLTVQVEYGERSYEIVDTKIVDADDRTIIVPTSPDEVLTVTTFYPFSFVGSAPDRYIINALTVDEAE